MNKRLLVAALIAIPLLRIIATYAVFSQTTASLAGVVKVKGLGDPLPGATVTITSPELQGSRSTIRKYFWARPLAWSARHRHR